MTTDVSGDIKKNINGSLLSGVILIVLGIVAIAIPAVSTIFAETWIALILASAGVTKIIYGFQNRNNGGFIWQILLGALYIATGIMLFTNPWTGIITLTLLLGSFLLTEGVFELILAFRLRPQSNWTWVLGDGIITLLLGALIWFNWPSNAPWIIGTLLGASILSTGVSRLMLSWNARAALESQAS
jgi:uncharacterized membrane protein HdeD (DUF308 family)